MIGTNGSPPAVGRKGQIVARAAELFDSHGYYVASMEDIAAAVGIAKPTLYHYFKSKNDILYAIHEEFIDLLIAEHATRVVAQPGISTDECLLGVMQDILQLMRTHRGHVRVFFENHRNLQGVKQDEIRTKRDAYTQTVTDLLHKGLSEGEFDCDPAVAALALFGMCNWAYQWYDAGGVLTTDDLAIRFWQILRSGIAPSAPAQSAKRRVPSARQPATR